MPIQTSCPHCQRGYTLADNTVGKKVRCKGCGETFTVQDDAVAEAPRRSRAASVPRERERQRERRPERGSEPRTRRRNRDEDHEPGFRVPIWAWAAGGGGVLLLFVVILLVILLRPSAQQPIAQGPIQQGNLPINPNVPPPFPGNPQVNPPANPNFNPPVNPPIKPMVPPVRPPEPAQPAMSWTSVVDPGPAVYTSPPPAKVGPMPIPGDNVKTVFPTTPSEFVAVHSEKFPEHTWQLLHGPSWKVKGGVQGKIDLKHPALSPDGKLLAGVSLADPISDWRSVVHVFSLNDSKHVGTIASEHPKDGGMGPQLAYVDFLPDGKVLVAELSNEAKFRVVDPATGATSSRFTVKMHLQRKNIAMSPGRKYLACAGYVHGIGASIPKLSVSEIATGREVAAAPNPEPGNKNIAVAYSPDGEEIAVLNENHDKGSLRVFSAKTGQRSVDQKLASPASATIKNSIDSLYDGKSLVWTPDKSAWLYCGEFLLANPTGSLIFKMPRGNQDYSHTERSFIGPDHLVATEGNYSKVAIQVVPMGRTEIAALVKKSTDATALRNNLEQLPAAKTGDLARATPLAAVGEAAPWPGLLPVLDNVAPPASAAKLQLTDPNDQPVDLVLGGAKSGLAVVLTHDGSDTSSKTGVVRAERYQLTTSKLLGSLPLFASETPKWHSGPVCRNVQLSPDGSILAVQIAKTPDRVELWDLVAGKYLGGLSPHPGKAIEGFAVLDGQKLWTVSNDVLVQWKAPTQAPGKTQEFEAVCKGEGYCGVPILSQNQKSLVVSTPQSIEFLDAETGARQGTLPQVDAASQGLRSGFFMPGGREFVGLVMVSPPGKEGAVGKINEGGEMFDRREKTYRLARWDLAKGVVLASFDPLTEGGVHATELAYAGPGHIFFNHHLYAWTGTSTPLLTFPQSRVTRTSPDGALRVYERQSLVNPAGGSNIVVPQLLVPNFFTPKLKEITAKLATAQKVVPAGSSFAINFAGGPPPEFTARVEKQLAFAVQQAGCKIGPGGFQINVQGEFVPTGKTIVYSDKKNIFGAAAPSKNAIKVQEHRLVITCRVTNPQGMEVFLDKGVVGIPSETKTDNVEQEIRDYQWRVGQVGSILDLFRRQIVDGKAMQIPVPSQY